MITTSLNLASEISVFSRGLVKQIIATALLIYVGTQMDFGLLLQPLASSEALVSSDIGLLAGLLALLFLAYSIVIQLKDYSESGNAQVTGAVLSAEKADESEIEKNTSTLYFWTGCICCVFFTLI